MPYLSCKVVSFTTFTYQGKSWGSSYGCENLLSYHPLLYSHLIERFGSSLHCKLYNLCLFVSSFQRGTTPKHIDTPLLLIATKYVSMLVDPMLAFSHSYENSGETFLTTLWLCSSSRCRQLVWFVGAPTLCFP